MGKTLARFGLTRKKKRRSAGARGLGHAPCGHWHTTTFVGALSQDGLLAPLVLDGPINGPVFVAWLEQFLAPELRRGDIRTLKTLWSAIGSLLDRFPPDECERYIRHCGYCQSG